MSIQPAPPITSLTNTKWDKPSCILPTPSLEFLFHLECNMVAAYSIAFGPFGERSAVIFKGGRFEGPRLRGEIIPGSGDWRLVRNHDGDQQTAHVDTRYNLQTHDGAVIYVQTTGTRTGSREVLEALNTEERPATEFRMRLHLTFETGDERYSWLNQGVFIASAGKAGDMVIYDAFQVL